MIAIIDYGMGNVQSIANMLDHLSLDAVITSNIEKISNASHLILPGVGAFDQAMTLLEELNLIPVIHQFATTGKPILGICLGMQLLGDGSEEGIKPGLSLIPFTNRRFTRQLVGDLRVPHMGWNSVTIQSDNLITKGLMADSRFYFVHSYFASDVKSEHVMLQSNYGFDFASAVCKGNIFGVQFHPEKSHAYGMALLEAFAKVN